MSDISLSIVPYEIVFQDRVQKAQQVVDWLISLNIIKPDKTDCILSKESGYPIDSKAVDITDDPNDLPYSLKTNGLQVITERTVFDAGEYGLDSFICPQCGEDIISLEWTLEDYHTHGDTVMSCPACHKDNSLNDYIIEPTWAFSNLGFTFWNWPSLKQEVIEDFERLLGCKVKVVECRI